MKKKILLAGILVLLSALSMAQYKTNKSVYDYRTYTYQPGDPYKPSAMCFASVVIPGLGEILEGEVKRGAAFLLSSLSVIVIKKISINQLEEQHSNQVQPYPNPTPNHEELEEEMIRKQNTIRITAIALQVGLRVFSGIDASRVAKVNNMAYRDRKLNNGKINFSPVFGIMENGNKENMTVVGFSLSGRF